MRPCADRDRAGERGFTLVEMLVALVLASLLMVAVVSGLRTMVEAERRQAALLASAGRTEAVDRAFRALVEGASGNYSGDARTLAFEGQLPASAAGHLRRARIEIGVEDGRLVARWVALLRDGEGLEVRGTAVLFERVSGHQFSYLASVDPAAPARWADRLQGNAVPRLIRLRLSDAERGPGTWPDIVAAPKVRETLSPRNK